ncbi:unnamed protein product [Haemonchus placei]|uniref:Transposase n=1 Tax=Haemonchus placei TaxID=6290 RepID=A0A0N4W1L3_HAEPC|nr:unnamed protein product [Haemonchus placei]
MAEILLRRSKNSGFLDSIVTSDEKWICFDNATRKRRRLDAGDTPNPTPKANIHDKKVMLCVWWNSKGLMCFEVFDSGQTATMNIYKDQLNRVDQTLFRQGFQTTSTARPHVAKNTLEKIKELGWEVLAIRHTAQTCLSPIAICSGRCSTLWPREGSQPAKKSNSGCPIIML